MPYLNIPATIFKPSLNLKYEAINFNNLLKCLVKTILNILEEST